MGGCPGGWVSGGQRISSSLARRVSHHRIITLVGEGYRAMSVLQLCG
jgi:hypothetical protein